ncbi:MAG: sulfate adenylyltransferase [Phycisphaeraceae bacterium]|nr:sulfate adenylyltransferase [Phycisphaerales bacterium]MCB9859409.1 sulfate adenylyltransferase [Phycisphaeraceae bacterium]
MSDLIAPHGGNLVDRVATGARRDELVKEAASLPRIDMTAKQSCDCEMIGIGAFSPLTGFMGSADVKSVITSMKLATGPAAGQVWPIPITLSVDSAKAPKAGDRVALYAPNGTLQAVMSVEEVFPHDRAKESTIFFNASGDDDGNHPGAEAVKKEGDTCIAGPIDVVTVCVDPEGPEAFLDHRLTPAQTRAEFAKRGWKTVAAFQTRNPIHRAHEYLCKCAQEICDGLLIHPLVGETKPGDIPADVRMQCYNVLIENYFVPERTCLTVMPAAMRYAGPREAILHALVRKNYGCTHFIVGRDHAGVGSYYGTYDAQNIFDTVCEDSVGIVPLKFEHAAYSKKAQGMVSGKTFPKIEGDQVFLSGTKVRDMLAAGERPPGEFSRPEVADVLIAWATKTPVGV